MVRHKKGYSTVAIIVVALLFLVAAAIHQNSTVQTTAYHPPSIQIPSDSRRQANSTANTLSPSPASSISPAQAPAFSAPTILKPSVIPTSTITQQTPTLNPSEFPKQ